MTPRLYKASEVCGMADVQAYVLRSWEKEFPSIGVQRSPDSPRLYRPSDVEQVRRIRQLVFVEGLTLAGARRRMEETSALASPDRDDEIDEVLDTLGANARARIAAVRTGLKSILEALSKSPGAAEIPTVSESEFALSPATAQAAPKGRHTAPARSGSSSKPVKAARRKSA